MRAWGRDVNYYSSPFVDGTMRWNIEGADQQTGQDRVIAIDAADQADAERKARARGILVSTIYPTTLKTAIERTEEEIVSPSQTAVPPAAPASTLNYRASSLPRQTVPNYRGLQIGSFVLGVFALLYYICGGIGLVFGILSVQDSSRVRFDAAQAFLWALLLAMGGGVLHAMSAACIALRDIARNSFNR